MMDGTLWHRTDETEREADGFLTGLAVGVVTDNQDPEKLARVRVRLPWHTGGDTSYWARPAMPMAGNDRGTYFLPEVGDEVLVAAEDGDPSHLYVLGVLWNGQQKPPADNDDGANNTRLLKSRSGHTVRFNDDDSQPEIEVKLRTASGSCSTRAGSRSTTRTGNTITFSASSGEIEISAAQKLTLKAPSVSIEATASMTVKSSGTLTLNGSVVQIN